MQNYDKTGNILGYKHEPRRVGGLLSIFYLPNSEEPHLILKAYNMYKYQKGKHKEPEHITIFTNTGDFLRKEFMKRKINPYLGLGFVIISEDMLNVARWDAKQPIVLRNQIYTFEGDLSSAKLEKLEDVGAFCIWELGIVNYEKEAWKRFLRSSKTALDKAVYLNDVIEGDL